VKAFALIGILATGCTSALLTPDYAAIRGANYVPSYASTSVAAAAAQGALREPANQPRAPRSR